MMSQVLLIRNASLGLNCWMIDGYAWVLYHHSGGESIIVDTLHDIEHVGQNVPSVISLICYDYLHYTASWRRLRV